MLERTWTLISVHFHPMRPESQYVILLTSSTVTWLKLYLITISALESTSNFVSLTLMGSLHRNIMWNLLIFDQIACVSIAADATNNRQLEALLPWCCRKRSKKKWKFKLKSWITLLINCWFSAASPNI